jgi:hypothetical protein
MNFGRAECSRYLTQILPIYGDFLRKCYSKLCRLLQLFLADISLALDECKSRALPEDADVEKLIDLEVNESFPITVDTLPAFLDA